MTTKIMGFFSSLFGGSPVSSSAQSGQSPPTEKRLLEDDLSLPKELLSHALPSTKQPAFSPQPLSESQIVSPSRQNKAPIVFAAGLAFTALSLLITRRSLARRRLTTKPSFSAQSAAQTQPRKPPVSGAFEAVEALGIASINVMSLAIAATGGTLWYLDIASIDDARRKLRGGMGVDESGGNEKDAEEEFEEWLATVLSRKEAKEERRRNDRERERERCS